jgi:TonB family protein
MPAQNSYAGSIIAIPTLREHGGRTFGTAVVLAAILHVCFALWFSMPHKAGGGSAGGGSTVDMENVNFSDNTTVPEAPTDMSYRPEVAALPDLGGGASENPSGPSNVGANAKIDENGIVMDAGGGGDVLKIGGKGAGLEDLLSLPKAGGSGTGKPGVGYRIKTYPPTVPFYKVEVKPTPISVPVPVYPDIVRTAGIEGSCVVEALLDLDGSVMDARVLKSSNNVTLDAAAVDAAKLAKFTPAKQRDKPVRVWVSIPYRFTLH